LDAELSRSNYDSKTIPVLTVGAVAIRKYTTRIIYAIFVAITSSTVLHATINSLIGYANCIL
jgi:hypothetical protein